MNDYKMLRNILEQLHFKPYLPHHFLPIWIRSLINVRSTFN
uniref:Uncharacterized protein n=1 Tax=Anguilla anguilla TaxID=7936 RepID=A0A0E9XSV6_ANGAN